MISIGVRHDTNNIQETHIGLGNTNHVPKNHDVNSYLMQHIEAKTPDEGHDRTDLTKYAT